MIRRPLVLVVALLLLAGSVAAASRAIVPPSAAELLGHVQALTASEMEGRGVATTGGDRATQYLSDRLAAIGLKPGGDDGSFLQSFAVSIGKKIRPGTVLERLGADPTTLAVGQDWTPHGGSLDGDVTGEIVFVGYGLAAVDQGWDDYAGIDVHDKIALALDGAPPFLREKPSRLEKLIAARRHGALALMLVADQLPSLDATAASVRLVSATLTGPATDLLLAPSGKRITQLRTELANARAPLSSATGVKARLRVTLDREDRRAANIIGVLPGTDPTRASEAVLLGAHYDHLGRAGGTVHPGADDNASGTAVVLGLARSLAAAGGTPRTLIFALFTGEEAGLLGSAQYVRHPTVPLDRTVAMLNFDMVGRMRDRGLHVGGVESGDGLRAIVSAAGARPGLNLVLHDSPYSPSDHIAFYEAGVPVLFFHTDGHEDYHTPGDTADKINAPGMAEVAAVAARVVENLGGEAHPAYVKLARPAPAHRASGASGEAFLGISVDAGSESDGVKLGSVLPDTAAARAGLKSGDVIVRLGTEVINNFGDVRHTLSTKRAGETISIVYLRDGEDYRVTAILGLRP